MQALHSDGHSSSRNSGYFWNLEPKFFASFIAVGNERFVCGLIGGGQLRFFGQTILQLSHEAAGLEG
jgi:hypothetical protein